jgi:hypothetical protein
VTIADARKQRRRFSTDGISPVARRKAKMPLSSALLIMLGN